MTKSLFWNSPAIRGAVPGRRCAGFSADAPAMPATREAPIKQWRHRATVSGWCLVAALTACAVGTEARGQSDQTGLPIMTYGAKQYPEDDALILRWEQHWTLEKDGTVRRNERKWLKLLNRRPIREYADPRIDYVEGQDQLIIHRAQTILPDQSKLPVPDYSFNTTAPDDVAGWPQYAGWQQRVVSFSGIEDNVVLDLDYEIKTPAGVYPWIEADLRLQEEYPTLERIISVTVPDGTPVHELKSEVLGLGPDHPFMRFESEKDGLKSTRWVIRSVPGARSEPESLPWQRRCGRLRFTTCSGPTEWFSTILNRVDHAAQPDDAIRKFAEATVEGEVNPAQRVRKVSKKIQDSFNFVTSPKALRSFACRPATDVFQANYGNGLESAALLTAALRALNLKPRLSVGVDGDQWTPKDEMAPCEGAFAGLVVTVDTEEGPLAVHPHEGVIENPGRWGHHWLVDVKPGGGLEYTYVNARGEDKPGVIEIAGKIAVDAEGMATGNLRFLLTGGFYDPLDLDSSDVQKSLVTSLAGNVLSGFDISGHSVITLSQEMFKATADVASKEKLKSLDGNHLVKLGKGPAFLDKIPLPLSMSQRHSDVQLIGGFRERVNLTIELPEGWKASVVPGSVGPVQGAWGQAAQDVSVDGRNIRFSRSIEVNRILLTPAEFGELRGVVNKLRTDRSLVLMCGKAP